MSYNREYVMLLHRCNNVLMTRVKQVDNGSRDNGWYIVPFMKSLNIIY